MSDQDQQYPHPPVPPAYGQMPPQGAMPRPMPMKMPAGMKMPPRPMGYPMPAGMKMPPRPMGYPMPQPVMPPPAAALPPEPDPLSSESVQDDASESQIDENGIIDDLDEEVTIEQDADEEEFVNPYDKNFASDLGLPPAFVRTPMMLFFFMLFTVVGAGLGFFYGTMDSRGADELPGVVTNAEIPKGRPRCGIAQKGQGCVFYVMNAQRREMEARDFFGIASDMLQIPKFQIETANIRYATMRIPPGYIALLNIPPVQ